MGTKSFMHFITDANLILSILIEYIPHYTNNVALRDAMERGDADLVFVAPSDQCLPYSLSFLLWTSRVFLLL